MKFKSSIKFMDMALIVLMSTAFVQMPKPNLKLEESGKQEGFLQFLSQFEKVELPFSIQLDDLEGYEGYRNKKNTAKKASTLPIKQTRFIPASEAGKFSRMGPPAIYPVARFYPNDNMVAVIYSSNQRFGGGLNTNYELIVYDFKGNIRTDKKALNAGVFKVAYSSMTESTTCTIDGKGNISLTKYSNQWKKDLTNHGLQDNQIVGFKKTGTTSFAINSNGIVQETKILASTRA